MKKIYILCFVLAACGGNGGSDGENGIPRPSSAYLAWLNDGHVGTEQDFLDSVVDNIDVHYMSLLDKAQRESGYTIEEMPWARHNNFYRITGTETAMTDSPINGFNSQSLTVTTYNEKEMNLANYGVWKAETTSEYEFGGIEEDTEVQSWIHNREGIGRNVYTPNNGTVFKGGTMAYVFAGSTTPIDEPTFIKGDAEYIYNGDGSYKLTLDFDNYYTFVFQTGATTTVSGTNGTGNNRYDLPLNNWVYVSGNALKTGFVKQGDIEEAVGTYRFYTIDASSQNVGVNGAFGGTKQLGQ